jgi:hypothetical protein
MFFKLPANVLQASSLKKNVHQASGLKTVYQASSLKTTLKTVYQASSLKNIQLEEPIKIARIHLLAIFYFQLPF